MASVSAGDLDAMVKLLTGSSGSAHFSATTRAFRAGSTPSPRSFWPPADESRVAFVLLKPHRSKGACVCLWGCGGVDAVVGVDGVVGDVNGEGRTVAR